MSTTTPEAEAQELIDRALKLPSTEQERILLALLHAVASPPGRPSSDREYWKAELARRIADVESGAVKPITPEEMHANIRKALEESRES
jgi:putative addiction module component (TIGR02574 family)